MNMKPMEYECGHKPSILYEGSYRGYDFRIISHGSHPCAYVKVSLNHPYFRKDCDKVGISCHGGLTFAGSFLFGDKPNVDIKSQWWFGWDYAHYGDFVGYSHTLGGKQWTTEEIYAETKYVIYQFAEVSKC